MERGAPARGPTGGSAPQEPTPRSAHESMVLLAQRAAELRRVSLDVEAVAQQCARGLFAGGIPATYLAALSETVPGAITDLKRQTDACFRASTVNRNQDFAASERATAHLPTNYNLSPVDEDEHMRDVVTMDDVDNMLIEAENEEIIENLIGGDDLDEILSEVGYEPALRQY